MDLSGTSSVSHEYGQWLSMIWPLFHMNMISGFQGCWQLWQGRGQTFERTPSSIHTMKAQLLSLLEITSLCKRALLDGLQASGLRPSSGRERAETRCAARSVISSTTARASLSAEWGLCYLSEGVITQTRSVMSSGEVSTNHML